MNKKGFTLVELLAVIIVLGIVSTIAVVSVIGVSSMIKSKILNEKLDLIESAAVMYGDDVKGSVMHSKKKYNGDNCISIIVSNLVPDYLDKDNNNDCLTEAGVVGCIVHPNNKDEYLDTKEVIIYYRNKRIYAKVDMDNNLTCSE